MFESSEVLIRTQVGTAEIRDKAQGLTQSERLVLIMVDGLTPFSQLREKLPVIPDQRFNKAVMTLQAKGLITVAPPNLAAADEDALAKNTVDRFLQQDPNDPSTVLMDEDEDDDDWKFAPPAPPPRAFDRSHIDMVEEVAQEVRAQKAARQVRMESIEVAQKNVEAQEQARMEFDSEARKKKPVRLSYIAFGLGVAFLAGFVLAKIFG